MLKSMWFKWQFSLQVPALECFQVNLNCLNPDNICFEKNVEHLFWMITHWSNNFSTVLRVGGGRGSLCNMAVWGHMLPPCRGSKHCAFLFTAPDFFHSLATLAFVWISYMSLPGGSFPSFLNPSILSCSLLFSLDTTECFLSLFPVSSSFYPIRYTHFSYLSPHMLFIYLFEVLNIICSVLPFLSCHALCFSLKTLQVTTCLFL